MPASRRSVVPVVEIHAGDALSNLELVRAGSERYHLAGRIGGGDHAGAVGPAVLRQVLDLAAVERYSPDVHEHLPGTRSRYRRFDHLQPITLPGPVIDDLARAGGSVAAGCADDRNATCDHDHD